MAEDQAVLWLEGHGFRILERNFRTRDGEIDVVATGGQVLAFVEVKSCRGDSHGSPLEKVGPAKQRTIVRVARCWLARHAALASRFDVRFDVVAVAVGPDGTAAEVTHVEDAFRAG